MTFNKSKTFNFSIDVILIGVMAILIVIGIAFIYSAESYHDQNSSILSQSYIKQLIFLIPGILLFIFFVFINYQKITRVALLSYLVIITLLILVLLIGKRVHGAKSWFNFFGLFAFQPSEIAKLFLIFILAKYIDKIGKDITRLHHFLICVAISLPPTFLVIIQPDLGTALVYIPITLAMLFIGGAKIRHLIVTIAIGLIAISIGIFSNYQLKLNEKYIPKDKIDAMVKNSYIYSNILSSSDIKELKKVKINNISNIKALRKAVKKKIKVLKKIVIYKTVKLSIIFLLAGIVVFTFANLLKVKILNTITLVLLVFAIGLLSSIISQSTLKPHHTTRILSFIDQDKDPKGVGYNQRQSIIAIGSGGATGHGWLQGPQNRLNFIPEKKTDFIFAVILEELGFLKGTILIIFLYSVLIYKGFIIAYNSKDHFGTLIATGITTMFFIHIFINIGMCIGILPVMGIPLPFLSSGGSSLITNIIGIALLVNIDNRKYVH